jgi:small redox-active disulfide protein 2
MNIEVLGPGCPRCKKTAKNVRKALDRLDVEAEVTKVEDQMEIIERGVMHTPAVAIDGEIATEGEIPDVDELVDIFAA